MTHSTRWLAAALAAGTASVTALLLYPREAAACGGCFAPDETVTVVDSHRMVVSLNLSRTILWDQIQYSGDPADFAWVLPIPTPEADVDVADNQFFEELETWTQVRVSAPQLPPLDCPPPPWDQGAGGLDATAAASDAGAGPDSGVDVYAEETVGPYETVIIGSEDPLALYTWLNDHGYSVPLSTLPVIEHYVDDGHKFLALRLAPEEGVDKMQPVRVSYPGYMASFPLKMVTVGAYGQLDMTMWVIAEQRYGVHNYGTVRIDPNALVWDFAAGRSNYGDLFRDAIEEAGGAAWVAEYAGAFDNLWFEAYEEAEVARNGHRFPYLTRLRTSVNVDNLGQDMLLAPSADASDISRQLAAFDYINAPNRQCPDWDGDGAPDTWDDYNDRNRGGRWIFGCSVGSAGGGSGALALIAGVAVALRRRRRSQSHTRWAPPAA